jgi:hypothetical protein
MKRYTLTTAFCLILVVGSARSQGDFTKTFTAFKAVAPGVDFFAVNRNEVTLFEKPVNEAQKRLAVFLGEDVAKGAIVICSNPAQRDAVTEVRLLRMGYKWALILMTPEATLEQRMAQFKAQGAEIPAQLKEQLTNPEMRATAMSRLVSSTVQRMCFSTLTTTMAPEKEFRPSRYDDVGRSPLSDWIDIGLVAYAIGEPLNLRNLQDRIDEAFPLEDVMSMSRPFVAPETQSGGGMRGGSGGNPGGGNRGQGGAPQGMAAAGSSQAGGAARGGGGRGREMPKEQVDRMFFDAQSSTFFAYLIEKLGTEKVKGLVQANKDGKISRDLVTSKEMLGAEFDTIEPDWMKWMKALQTPDAGPRNAPGRPSGPPENF